MRERNLKLTHPKVDMSSTAVDDRRADNDDDDDDTLIVTNSWQSTNWKLSSLSLARKSASAASFIEVDPVELNTLQCIAFQSTALHFSVYQCIAVHFSVFKCIAVHCSAL